MATATEANGNGRRNGRLKSWKEIAAFFGADERTVRRWEERGLPVRRIPGGGRATVYAEVEELQAWLQRSKEPTGPTVEPTASDRRPSRHLLLAIAAVLLLFA